jgi:hypothetical protein
MRLFDDRMLAQVSGAGKGGKFARRTCENPAIAFSSLLLLVLPGSQFGGFVERCVRHRGVHEGCSRSQRPAQKLWSA